MNTALVKIRILTTDLTQQELFTLVFELWSNLSTFDQRRFLTSARHTLKED